jgi:ribosomal protein L37AE/L43A
MQRTWNQSEHDAKRRHAKLCKAEERMKRRQTARCDYCRRTVQYDVNGIGMWICPHCHRDMTPPQNAEVSDGGH